MPFSLPDTATATYLAGVGPAVYDLRLIAAQVAGCMVLREVQGGLEVPQQLVLAIARQLLDVAREDLETQSAPEAARPYSEALLQAAIALSSAFPEDPQAHRSLYAAMKHLEQAAHLHPSSFPTRLQ